MRIAFLIAFIFAFMISPSAYSATISPNSLLQYQYDVDVAECNLVLGGELGIEFSGVFANEKNETVFHEIIVFTFDTKKTYGFGRMLELRYYDTMFPAKVVKIEEGKVSLATDALALNLLWGGDGTFGVHQWKSNSVFGEDYFSLPGDPEESRIALSKSKTCYQNALNSN